MEAPKWAQDLVVNTILFVNPDAPLPEIRWRRGSAHSSSGNSKPEYITITAGIARRDAKLVLLHELAHWLLPRIKKTYGRGKWQREFIVCQGHTDEFWDLAWSLYRWAKLPVAYCKQREFTYKAGAKKAYLRSRKEKG